MDNVLLFDLKFISIQHRFQVQLFDVLVRPIANQLISLVGSKHFQGQFETSNLASGSYFILVKGDAYTKILKIEVVH